MEIHYTISKDDFGEAVSYYGERLSPSSRRIKRVMGRVLVIIFIVYLLVIAMHEEGMLWFLLPCTALLMLVYLGYWPLMRIYFKRGGNQYIKNELGLHRASVNAGGLTHEYGAYKFQYGWAAIEQIIQTEQFVFFLGSPLKTLTLYIPRASVTKGDLEAFVSAAMEFRKIPTDDQATK